MIILSRPDYQVTGEFLWFGVVLHIERPRIYNKSTLKRLRDDARLIALSFRTPVYAFQTITDDPLKGKFIRNLGFTLSHYRVTGEGEWAQMYTLHPMEVKGLAS